MYVKTTTSVTQKMNNSGIVFLIPFQASGLGPETTASMSVICREVRKSVPASIPVGVQILAGANR